MFEKYGLDAAESYALSTQIFIYSSSRGVTNIIKSPRHIPSVDSLLNAVPVQEIVRKHGKVLVKKYAKSILDQARQTVLAGGSTDMDELVQL